MSEKIYKEIYVSHNDNDSKDCPVLFKSFWKEVKKTEGEDKGKTVYTNEEQTKAMHKL